MLLSRKMNPKISKMPLFHAEEFFDLVFNFSSCLRNQIAHNIRFLLIIYSYTSQICFKMYRNIYHRKVERNKDRRVSQIYVRNSSKTLEVRRNINGRRWYRWEITLYTKSDLIYVLHTHIILFRKTIYYDFLVWKNSVRYYKIRNRASVCDVSNRHDKFIKCQRAHKIAWPRQGNCTISRNSRKIDQSVSIKQKIMHEIKRRKYNKNLFKSNT